MKENSSSIKERQRSRSFPEVVAVYKKLVKSYLHSFFLWKDRYLLVLAYLAGSVLPLTFFLLNKWMKGSLANYFPEHFWFKITTQPSLLFAFLYHPFFIFSTVSSISRNLYFLNRKVNEEASLRELAILSSVKNIALYDIFIFEVTVTFLLHFLYFSLLLTAVSLASSNQPGVFQSLIPHAFYSFLLGFLSQISSSDSKNQNQLAYLLFSLSAIFEYFLLMAVASKVNFSSELVVVIRMSWIVLFSLRALYVNLLKIKRLRD